MRARGEDGMGGGRKLELEDKSLYDQSVLVSYLFGSLLRVKKRLFIDV